MTVDVRVSETPAPAEADNRRPDIQGLRALAVLLVVAFHAGLPIPGGFVGVDVFFVISGFVITGMLMRQWAASGRIALGSFYLRRFLRLTPALALVVTVVALASILLQSPFGAQQATARTGLGAMLLSANGVIAHASGDYFAQSAVTNPLLNTWSLSVEEQFYLVFPALFILGWTLSRRFHRRLLAPVLIILAVAFGSFALGVALSHSGTLDGESPVGGSPVAGSLLASFGGAETFAFYSPFTRAWEFAVGALLALVVQRVATTRRVAGALGLAGASLVLLAAVVINESSPFPGVIALLPVAGTTLLLLAGAQHVLGVNRVLATRPMVVVGDLSYSWYLWHWPVIVFAVLLVPGDPTVRWVAAVVSLIPAVLSYRLVEQPLRRLRPRTRARGAAVIATTLWVPVVACLVLLVGANAGWGLTQPPDAASLVAGQTGQNPARSDAASGQPEAPEDPVADGEVAGGEGGSLRSQHVVVQAGCVNTALEPRRCRFGPTNPRGTVLLAGDSQAYAVADGVIGAAEQLGYATIVTSHTGCPFLARESSGAHNYPCRSWQRSIVEYALSERPDVVVIANRSAGYVHPEWGWRTAATDDGRRATSPEEAADLWRQGLDPIVAALREAGIGVVILAAVPEMTGYTDRTSLMAGVLGSRDFTASRQQSERDRQPALAAELDVAAQHPGTVVHDPNPALCDDDTCWATKGGAVLYQDETHLSVAGSLLLADGMREAIRAALPSTS